MARTRPQGSIRGRVTLFAIGPNGWPHSERIVDRAVPLIVEEVADELRSAVRSASGWLPRIAVLDERGRDITASFNVR
jgi:hypothetical protein